MRETVPEIYLISRPALDWVAIRTYLESVGGLSWYELRTNSEFDKSTSRAHDDAECLVEFAGRFCYRSWKPGLNANVTKIRTEQREYFDNLLKSAHGSVLEHANFTFVFHNVSRVFTHELVRHRAGSAFSQESLRYVRLTDIGFRIPPALEPIEEAVVNIVETLEEFQIFAAQQLGLDNEGDELQVGEKPISFAQKKEITSAMRRLAPIGLSTGIVWTANIRTIRHVLASRTAEGAEEEIRYVFDHVGEMMSREAPLLFQDFTREENGAWIPANPVAGQTRVV